MIINLSTPTITKPRIGRSDKTTFAAMYAKPAPKAAATKPAVKAPAKPAAKAAVKQPAAKPVTTKTTAAKPAEKKPAPVKAAAPVSKPAAVKAAKPAAVKAVPAAKPVAKEPAVEIVNEPAVKVVPVKPAPKQTSKREPTPPPMSSTVLGFIGISPYIEKNGEEYMNEPQRKHFINILNAWKRSLMDEVDRTVSHMKDEAANFPDPNDRASQEEEFSLELRTRDRERKLIKKIEEAIETIKMDDYGYCEACGIEIGIRRLEARPTATLCIDCKTLDEI